MAKTVQQRLNSYMPAVLDKNDTVYKAVFADEDSDGGALANELKTLSDFIDYYTRTQSVDGAESALLAYIASTFAGLTRNYSEPDSYLRLRYKALIERKQSARWNGGPSIKNVFAYFFEEKNIYLIERYPVHNLVSNGGFDSLDGWYYDESDTEFKLVYSRSFENGSSILINPGVPRSSGYMEQKITGVVPGLYELVFFFSSYKSGPADIGYSVRDGSDNYWDGEAWRDSPHSFLEEVDDPTAGQYKKIQRSVTVPSETDIYIRFTNLNGNGVLLDGVRFGKIESPAVRLYILTDPEIFYNGAVTYNKQYTYSGFKKFYILSDMESIFERIKPAGVYGELSILTSRLNLPWDRIIVKWESVVKPYWHILYDGTKKYNAGIWSYIQVKYDGSVFYDSALKYDGLQSVFTIRPNDTLYGASLYHHTKTYIPRFRESLKRSIHYDNRVGYSGRFHYSDVSVGINIGISSIKVIHKIVYSKTGRALYNGVWEYNAELRFDGIYTYNEDGIETYFAEEIEYMETHNLKRILAEQAIAPPAEKAIGKIGFGEGGGAATPNDTALTNPYIKHTETF
jgi:hypothetical protein